MPRELNRKITDSKGHQWAISLPPDFDADNIEDVVLAMHEGLAKIVGYKLDGEESWRLPDNTELGTLKKQTSFFKKMNLGNVSQEDFSEAVQKLIDRARESKIGKAKITEWEGQPIKFDHRGPYIDASVPCNICEKPIKGIKRLSQSDGVYTRAQMMIPSDPKAIQMRPGSKLKVCGECAPKHLHPSEAGLPFPTVQEVVIQKKEEAQIAAVEAEEIKVKVKAAIKKDVLGELLAMAQPTSQIDPIFLKGMLYGYLKSSKAKGD